MGPLVGTALACLAKAYLSLRPPPVPVITVTCCFETLCQLSNGSFWLLAVDEAETCWPGWKDDLDHYTGASGQKPKAPGYISATGRWRYLSMENILVNLDEQ